ncbi:hypothetical protein ACFL5Z_06890 [Planctomycetota bacterium]
MTTSGITERVALGVLIGFVLLGAYSAPALGHFAITYYDNYNYDTGQWDAWQSTATPLDAWDNKYLADGLSGNTIFTDHAFTSIPTFDLRGDLWSKDGHGTGGEDWNPLESIEDNASGQSPHHVFAALFKGLIYLEEGDVFSVASDDDVYIFLDGNTAWGQEVLSVPYISYFDTDSMTVTASQAGYHTMTVKFIERRNTHSGIEITLNGEHLQNAEVPIDIKPGSYPNSINPNAGGVIPVAILGTATFDASTVDPATVALEGAGAKGKGKSGNYGSMEDVDGDGYLDLVVQIVNDITWAPNATEATLTGQTWAGIPIQGTDSVNIVPPE